MTAIPLLSCVLLWAYMHRCLRFSDTGSIAPSPATAVIGGMTGNNITPFPDFEIVNICKPYLRCMDVCTVGKVLLHLTPGSLQAFLTNEKTDRTKSSESKENQQ